MDIRIVGVEEWLKKKFPEAREIRMEKGRNIFGEIMEIQVISDESNGVEETVEIYEVKTKFSTGTLRAKE